MHLGTEGLSIAEIAKILDVSERTIHRDRRVNQEENALQHDPRLAGLMAGRLVAEADLVMQRIRRVTRDAKTLPAVKVEGEKACFDVVDRLVARLQFLGYLPTAAQRFEADIRQTSELIPGYDQLHEEVDNLLVIARREGNALQIEHIQELSKRLNQAELVEQVQETKAILTSGPGEAP
ncbi:MAG: hypothetical protein IT442_05210 [Phycisphaeraceae bacterium]|nr:hypothetical protein [Phycisphaeraceae bacterium]